MPATKSKQTPDKSKTTSTRKVVKKTTTVVSGEEFLKDPRKYAAMASSYDIVEVENNGKLILVLGGKL